MGNETIFREGDLVKVPWSSEVHKVEASKIGRHLIIVDGFLFFSDGRLKESHDNPLLTMIKRRVTMISKTYWVATGVSTHEKIHSSMFKTCLIAMREGEDMIKSIETDGYTDVQFHKIERVVGVEDVV